jgi:hypothetical protein
MTLRRMTLTKIITKPNELNDTQQNDTQQNDILVKDCQLNNINHNDSEMKCYGPIACHSKYTSMLSDILANAIIPRKSNLDSQRLILVGLDSEFREPSSRK